MKVQSNPLTLYPLCLATLVGLLSPHAQASGYYGGPIGATATGRGGSLTVRGNDLSAAYYNPAAFALMKGTRLQLDNKFSYGAFEYTREPTWNNTAPDANDPMAPPPTLFPSVENTKPLRLLGPIVGVASNLGLDSWGFALVAYTPSGSASVSYPVTGPQRYMVVERNATIANAALNVAWAPLPNLAIGVSAQALIAPSLVYQLVVDANPSSFDAYRPVSSPFDMLATLKVSDPFTPTAIVGVWYQPTPFLEFGLSGQVLPAAIDAKGSLTIVPVDAATVEVLNNADVRPEDAVTLNRDGVPNNDVSLTMPLPLTARVGVRYIQRDGARERFDVELNLAYEGWSAVDNFVLDSRGLSATFHHPVLSATPIPLGKINVTKQWRDTLTISLGGDFAATEVATLRAGGYYETAVADPAHANVDFPSGAYLGAAAGATFNLGPIAASIAYEYRHMLGIATSEQDGQVRQVKPALLDAAPGDYPVVNAGDYKYQAHNLALSLAYQF